MEYNNNQTIPRLTASEYAKRWRDKNIEKAIAHDRQYRIDNKDKISKSKREYYLKNKEAIIERMRLYRSSHPEYSKANNRHWTNYKNNNPEKVKARWRIKELIESGKIIRPQFCSNNKKECNGKIEAHHSDYNKPLEIIWLCRKCHIETHNNLKQQTE